MLIPFKYLCEHYKIAPKGVIHVGAHYGEEIHDYYQNGVETTFWIEANPSVYETLQSKINQLDYPQIIASCACLSDKVGETPFNLTNNSQSSSMLDLAYHKVAHPEVHVTEVVTLKTTTLDAEMEYLTDRGLSFDFLNADIQGAELMMLKGATKALQYLKYLYLEVNQKPLYEGCAMIEEIDKFVFQFGFERVEVAWCGNFGWGDAFYIKK